MNLKTYIRYVILRKGTNSIIAENDMFKYYKYIINNYYNLKYTLKDKDYFKIFFKNLFIPFFCIL